MKDSNPWAQSVMDKIVAEFNATVEKYPHTPPNAPDPYVPVRKKAERLVSDATPTLLWYVVRVVTSGPPRIPLRRVSTTSDPSASSESVRRTSIVIGLPVAGF